MMGRAALIEGKHRFWRLFEFNTLDLRMFMNTTTTAAANQQTG